MAGSREKRDHPQCASFPPRGGLPGHWSRRSPTRWVATPKHDEDQVLDLHVRQNALDWHERWPQAWRSPAPRREYEALILGGGDGLAAAYYLAAQHGSRDVAVLEKSWLGGGNTGRNTTIVRSNYHLGPNAHMYEFSMKLWEGLSRALNFNVMYSARGVLNLAHTAQELDAFARRGNAMRLNGIDAELLTRDRHFGFQAPCT